MRARPLRELSAIWNAELAPEGIQFVSLDPGDMDTALHAIAVPDADRGPSNGRRLQARTARCDCCRAAQFPFNSRSRLVIAADSPFRRPPWAKLLVVRANGEMFHSRRAAFVDFLQPGDVVIANDAATLPASLQGQHAPSGFPIEIRLAGRHSLGADDVLRFSAVVFGAGDYRTRTQNREPPPRIAPGDRLDFGPLSATVEQLLGHPRLAAIRFEGRPEAVWTGLARYGRPIRYAPCTHPTDTVGRLDVDRGDFL